MNLLNLQEPIDWSRILYGSDVTVSTTRRLRYGRYGKRINQFPSRKNNQSLKCESLLEAEFCLELERSPTIASYIAQPCTLYVEETSNYYTPDFFALTDTEEGIFFEIKSELAGRDAEKMAKLAIYEGVFTRNDISFEIIFQHDFFHPIKSTNLKYLYFHCEYPDQGQLEKILDQLKARPLSVRDLIGLGIPSGQIAYAVFFQIVYFDIFSPFTLDSILRADSS
ncbi:TnsA endonuclease N-terminal domain-containing protein [Pseudomonas sp. C9-3]|uniref:TnsA endonuclease N-terminal domain-containing protein n=1 Tax=Pseudomonas sp. C9-3 TaxID=3078264 RepID=UPI0028F16624|nr:TnsA endonuclease N-terminal domain-containing protein [Pseudomonas sp. C9-3]